MAYTKHLYHIVSGTKRREKIITARLAPRLYKYMGGIISNLNGIPVEINGMADHIHILTYVSPSISISDFVRIVKANSSRWVNELPDYKHTFRWASKYGSFSVSETHLEVVRRYIQNQQQHHAKETWESECKHLLGKHGIEYEEKYLWD